MKNKAKKRTWPHVRGEHAEFLGQVGGNASGIVRDDGSIVITVTDAERREAHFALELPEEMAGDLRAADLNELPDDIDVSFSSERPVMRYGDNEILSHDPDDADFSRLAEVGAALKNHNPNIIVGTPVKVWLDAGARKGRATIRFGTTGDALKAKREALIDKSLRGVSVGYRVSEYVFLPDADVRYKDIRGPAYVATKWEALELSLTPVAADPSVGIGRMEKQSRERKHKQEENKVDPKFKQWLIGRGLDPEELSEDTISSLRAVYDHEQRSNPPAQGTLTLEPKRHEPPAQEPEPVEAEKIRAEAAKAERERASAISQLCNVHGISDEHRTSMIDGGLSLHDAQARALDILAQETRAMGPGSVEVLEDDRSKWCRAAMEACDMKAGQLAVRDTKHGGEAFAVMSLKELARESLKRAGMKIPTDVQSMVSMACRGPVLLQSDIDRFMRGGEIISTTTSDFPYILAATANKSMLGGYGTAKVTYPLWCKIGSLSDFKAMNRVKLSEAGDLQQVLEGGKYQETAFSEDQNSIQVYTYGLKWNLSRQAIVNDDMNAFTTIPARLGRSARRLPNILAVVSLLSNPTLNDGTALFAGGHNNLGTGAGYALDTIAHAQAGMIQIQNRLQTQRGMLHAMASAASRTLYLGLELELVLVATNTQAFYAKSVLGATANPSQSNPAVPNPLEGIATVATEPLLADSQISGYSSSAYYGVASTADAPVMEVAFLNGVQEPYMEETDQTDADGRSFKIREDCGAAPIDYAGMCKETGA